MKNNETASAFTVLFALIFIVAAPLTTQAVGGWLGLVLGWGLGFFGAVGLAAPFIAKVDNDG